MHAQAFLFDMDGTLVDSERANIESVAMATREYGHELDADDRSFIVGHSWREIHARICKKFQLSVPLDEMIALAVEKKRALILGDSNNGGTDNAQHGLAPLPGAVETVRRLAARGARLAVVSGASRVEIEDVVNALGIASCFAFIIGAEDYARGKPDPEPYAKAIAKFGVSAAATIVLEDAAPGIASGRAAGARVVGIRAGNFAGHDLSAAHVCIDTLNDFSDDLIRTVVSASV